MSESKETVTFSIFQDSDPLTPGSDMSVANQTLKTQPSTTTSSRHPCVHRPSKLNRQPRIPLQDITDIVHLLDETRRGNLQNEEESVRNGSDEDVDRKLEAKITGAKKVVNDSVNEGERERQRRMRVLRSMR